MKVVQLAEIDVAYIEKASRWYAAHTIPEPFRKAHPRVLRVAGGLADGDWQRCVINDDGSITVYNYRVWER